MWGLIDRRIFSWRPNLPCSQHSIFSFEAEDFAQKYNLVYGIDKGHKLSVLQA
jgi:hypothetical protein